MPGGQNLHPISPRHVRRELFFKILSSVELWRDRGDGYARTRQWDWRMDKLEIPCMTHILQLPDIYSQAWHADTSDLQYVHYYMQTQISFMLYPDASVLYVLQTRTFNECWATKNILHVRICKSSACSEVTLKISWILYVTYKCLNAMQLQISWAFCS
jgi:hypothetical protein